MLENDENPDDGINNNQGSEPTAVTRFRAGLRGLGGRQTQLEFNLPDGYTVQHVSKTRVIEKFNSPLLDKAYQDMEAHSFYTLNNKLGRPVALICTKEDSLVGCIGKDNKLASIEDRERILAFINARNIKPEGLAYKTGLVATEDGNIHDITNLPQNARVKGTLDMSQTDSPLPPGLSVTGDLILLGYQGTQLPSGLTVGGKIIAIDSALTHVGDNVTVKDSTPNDYYGQHSAILPATVQKVGDNLKIKKTLLFETKPWQSFAADLGGGADIGEIQGVGTITVLGDIKLGTVNACTSYHRDGYAIPSIEIKNTCGATIKAGNVLLRSGGGNVKIPEGVKTSGTIYLPYASADKLPATFEADKIILPRTILDGNWLPPGINARQGFLRYIPDRHSFDEGMEGLTQLYKQEPIDPNLIRVMKERSEQHAVRAAGNERTDRFR